MTRSSPNKSYNIIASESIITMPIWTNYSIANFKPL